LERQGAVIDFFCFCFSLHSTEWKSIPFVGLDRAGEEDTNVLTSIHEGHLVILCQYSDSAVKLIKLLKKNETDKDKINAVEKRSMTLKELKNKVLDNCRLFWCSLLRWHQMKLFVTNAL